MTLEVVAKEVCAFEPEVLRVEVAADATVAAVKRSVHAARPRWAPEKQMVGREGAGAPLADGDAAAPPGGGPAGGARLLCWVACVCQQRPRHQFLPRGYVDRHPAAEAPEEPRRGAWEDVID